MLIGRICDNTTSVTNSTFTASQNDNSEVMGIVGYNFYAIITFSGITVSNVLTYSSFGDGVLIGVTTNGTLNLLNSTITSMITVSSANYYQGVIQGIIDLACSFVIQNVRLNLYLPTGNSYMGAFGNVNSGCVAAMSVSNFTMNITGLKCF